MKKDSKTGGFAGGIKSIAGRTNLKTQMEMIINRTGHSVKFQGGHTFAELPVFFVPRLIWPGKPTVSVGQLFNREFHVSLDPNTYISTSFIGEMYWNFGWAGIFVGMMCTGVFWGGIGGSAAMGGQATVSRMLILVSAIYLLIIRFETGYTQQNILFMRSAGIILILHIMFKNRGK
jgi:hypothetical protein